MEALIETCVNGAVTQFNSVSVLQCSDVGKVDEARKLLKGVIDLEVFESPLKILG